MLNVGYLTPLTGNVTTLNWIGPKPAVEIERSLGYGPGRLRQGYWVALLNQALTPDDFEFDGTTLRSDGRLGLPAQNAVAHSLRTRVHDQILAERGKLGYRTLQEWALRMVKLTGPERIAKVVPVTPHNKDMEPARQYPMGGGGLQWKIKEERPALFLVAMHVDPAGMATTPTFTVSLAEGRDIYENRVKIRRYLEAASC